MNWSLGDFWDDEFVKRTGRTVKSLTDGSLAGATSLASPLGPPVAGLTVPREVSVPGSGSSGNPQLTLIRFDAFTCATPTGSLSFDWVVKTADADTFFTPDAGGVTVLQEGYYRLSAYIDWTYPSTGRRATIIHASSGSSIEGQSRSPQLAKSVVDVTGIDNVGQPVTVDLLLPEGEYIRVDWEQDSGGTTYTLDGVGQRLTIEKLADASVSAL